MALQLEEKEVLNLLTSLVYKPALKRSQQFLPALPNNADKNKTLRGKKNENLKALTGYNSDVNINEHQLTEDPKIKYIQQALGIAPDKFEQLLMKTIKMGNEKIAQKELNLYTYFLMRDKGILTPLDFDSDKIYNKWKSEEKKSLDELPSIYQLEPMNYLIGTNNDIIPIRVTCFKAQGLKSKGKNDTCHAYCTIDVNGERVATSFVAGDSTDPMWDLTQILLLDGTKTHEISIQVWHRVNHIYDSNKEGIATTWREKDAFLGCYNIKVTSDLHDEEGWYKVEKRSARSNVSGKLYVSIDKINQNTRLTDLYAESFICIPSNPRFTFSKLIRLFFEYDSKLFEAILESDIARKIVRYLRDLWRIDENTWFLCKIQHAANMLISNRISPLQFNANIVGCVMSCESSLEFLATADSLAYIECRDTVVNYMKNKVRGYLLEDHITLRTWDDFRISTMMLADIHAAMHKHITGNSKSRAYFDEFLTDIVPVLKSKLENICADALEQDSADINHLYAIALEQYNKIIFSFCEFFSNSRCLEEFGYPLELEKKLIISTYEILQEHILPSLKFNSPDDAKSGLEFYKQLCHFYATCKIVDSNLIVTFASGLDIVYPLFNCISKMIDHEIKSVVERAIKKDDFSPVDPNTPYSTSFVDCLKAFNEYVDFVESIENIDTYSTKTLATNILASIISATDIYMRKMKTLTIQEAASNLAFTAVTTKVPTSRPRRNSVFQNDADIKRSNTRRLGADSSKFDTKVLRISKHMCVKIANVFNFAEQLLPIYTRLASIKRYNLINSRLGVPVQSTGVDPSCIYLVLDIMEIQNSRPHVPFNAKLKIRLLYNNEAVFETKPSPQSKNIVFNEQALILADPTESGEIPIEVQLIQVSPFKVTKKGEKTSIIRNKEYLISRHSITINGINNTRTAKIIPFDNEFGSLYLMTKPDEAILTNGVGNESDFLMKIFKSRSEFYTSKMVDSFVESLCYDFRESLKDASRKYKTQAQALVTLLTKLKLKDAFSSQDNISNTMVIGSDSEAGDEAITAEKVEIEIQNLLYMVNENLALIMDSVDQTVSHRIVEEVWNWMLWVCESCIVPELEDNDTSKDIWESNRILFLFYSINYLLEFFYADGDGISLGSLRNSLFKDLILIVTNYNSSTSDIKEKYLKTIKNSDNNKSNVEFSLFAKLLVRIDEVSPGEGLLRLLKLRKENDFVNEALKLKVGLSSNLK